MTQLFCTCTTHITILDVNRVKLRRKMFSKEKIVQLQVQDVRYPTSKTLDGSDSVHTDPDYSVAYVTLTTDTGASGYGITFTLGAGTDVVVKAIELLKREVVDKSVHDILTNYRAFYRSLTQDSQMRWLGPEKGIVHLATAAVTNAVWDLAARLANKPLWRFVVDIPVEDLVAMIDWSYTSDVISETEIVEMLKEGQSTKEERIKELEKEGYPAYITSVGWLGYSDEKVKRLTNEKLGEGWTAFKMKVCSLFIWYLSDFPCGTIVKFIWRLSSLIIGHE